MFEMEQIGRRIADHRKKQNMTQQDLADQLGVTYQAVSNWERGLSVPDVLRLKDIAQRFEITLDELMGNPQDARVVKVAAGEEKPESIRELTESAPYMKPRDLEERLMDQVGITTSPKETASQTSNHPTEKIAPEQKTTIGADPSKHSSSTGSSGSQELSLEDLAGMAPFLSPEVLARVTRRLLDSGSVSSLESLTALAPFLDPDGLLELVLASLDQKSSTPPEFLPALAPFLEPEGLEAITDRLIADSVSSADAGFSLEQLLSLAPFMDSEALGRMALRLTGSGQGRPEDIIGLAPFLEAADIRELIKASSSPSRELIRGLLPFLDEDDMEELIMKSFGKN